MKLQEEEKKHSGPFAFGMGGIGKILLDIIMAEQQSVAPRGYKVITVVGDSFTPDGHQIATYITSKFKERVSPSGTTWKHVDQVMKSFYYNEFVKRYTWVDRQEEEFKATWNAYCAKLYRDHMYYMRKKGTSLRMFRRRYGVHGRPPGLQKGGKLMPKRPKQIGIQSQVARAPELLDIRQDPDLL